MLLKDHNDLVKVRLGPGRAVNIMYLLLLKDRNEPVKVRLGQGS